MSFLLINKESGWTSLDVVAKLRGFFHIEKIGHAGTLDPFATGLLIVGVGRDATKRLEEFKNLDKEYEVEFKFGFTSDTYDCDGQITANPNAREISRPELEAVLTKYIGPITQLPPMYSAKKVNGVRLHKLARQGVLVDRPLHHVVIHKITVLECTGTTAKLRVNCGPGTYIRTLVHDVGQDLGVGAYATGLTRTRVGKYKLKNAKTLAEVAARQYSFFNFRRFKKVVLELYASCVRFIRH